MVECCNKFYSLITQLKQNLSDSELIATQFISGLSSLKELKDPVNQIHNIYGISKLSKEEYAKKLTICRSTLRDKIRDKRFVYCDK